MDHEVAEAMGRFFLAQKRLNELDVIKSRDYIGDIGRYLCRVAYGLELPRGARPSEYDGKIGSWRVAVRMNNCPTGTPVRVPDEMAFDELIVILGPNCFLRPPGVASDLIFYRLSPEQVKAKFKAVKSGYAGGRDAFDRTYDRVMNLTAG